MPIPCFESIQLVAIRAHRLQASGALQTGANNAYQSSAAIQIQHGFEYEAGADITQKNGAGSICLRFRGEDKVKNVTVTMNLCQLDYQLIELLTGWTALTDLEGDVIGIAAPGLSDPDRNGVVLEGWSRAWDGDAQAVDGGSNVLYHRWVWPRLKLNVGDFTIEEGALVVPVTGQGFSNALLSTALGPAGDWPVGGIDGAFGVYLDPSIPVPTCQYLTSPTGS